MAKFLNTILQRIKRVETICSVLILAFLVGSIAMQVLMRYLFRNPMTWPEELAALLLIYLSFLTADVVYKEKGHIAIDYVVGFLGNKTKIVVALFVYLFIGIVLVVITQVSLPLIKIQFGHTTAAALRIPKSFWTLPVPIIFCSMLLTTFHFMLEEIEKLRKGTDK
jgi:TRAP-type C4-dicarboxylate transport system permease small subunit